MPADHEHFLDCSIGTYDRLQLHGASKFELLRDCGIDGLDPDFDKTGIGIVSALLCECQTHGNEHQCGTEERMEENTHVQFALDRHVTLKPAVGP